MLHLILYGEFFVHRSLDFHRRIVGFTWLWKNRVDLCKRWQWVSWLGVLRCHRWAEMAPNGNQKRRFTPHWTVNSCWRASKFKLVQDILIFTCLIPCAGGRGSILYPMLPRGKRRMMLKKRHATRVLDCYQCWNNGRMDLKGLIWCQVAFLFSYWKTCSWDFWTYFLYQFCYLSD